MTEQVNNNKIFFSCLRELFSLLLFWLSIFSPYLCKKYIAQPSMDECTALCYEHVVVGKLLRTSKNPWNEYMGFLFKVSLIVISHFITNFSFKCFHLCNHPVCFFSFSTLVRLSVAKSKISLGECHIVLENMWLIFEYLLKLISNIIPQWWEQTLWFTYL